ncbi:hypothetical protein SAMN05421736_1011021 [Evansella caseinilytica]|uniref:Uncharacterized protein n=1 Tax=Evansella caseinilytica TaxID=1503961 RepID=A0A1H3J4L7_9BACI|nr:hypothetical protein [Evansella caseinilytica]SDY34842.1 hypothetical protein SAMN05421736_1011021 [Evansella caseinilytica]
MKQVLPLMLIAIIVGGALFFLSDSYEEERFLPEWSNIQTTENWEVTLFFNEIHSDTPEIGVRLELLSGDHEIAALEFFMETWHGGFYYQDLTMNNFDGTVIYSENCQFCTGDEPEYGYGNLVLNWRQNGEIYTEFIYFDVLANGLWFQQQKK